MKDHRLRVKRYWKGLYSGSDHRLRVKRYREGLYSGSDAIVSDGKSRRIMSKVVKQMEKERAEE